MEAPPLPKPYIAPRLRIEDGRLDTAEVIIIKAHAAVGKTVTARYLSANRNAPLLDLSKTRVGSNTFSGSVPAAFQAEFHEGKFPVIVDALDEGSLLSGDSNRDEFLYTFRDFLASNRSVSNRAKVVFLGRFESIDWLHTIIADGEEISVCVVVIEFFDESAAKELIALYSEKEIDTQEQKGKISAVDARRLRGQVHGGPRKKLVAAYFSLLERALGLAADELWSNPKGQSFAGYAPVLASIGELLAPIEDSHGMTSKLVDGESRGAWDVIDRVIEAILDREQDKVRQPLEENSTSSAVPAGTYSTREQLTYLTQIVQENDIVLTDEIEEEFNRDARAIVNDSDEGGC